MNLFKRKKVQQKTKCLKALRDFDATKEGYKVKKDEYIFITKDKEPHRVLFVTEERAQAFIDKRVNNEPIVEEIEL